MKKVICEFLNNELSASLYSLLLDISTYPRYSLQTLNGVHKPPKNWNFINFLNIPVIKVLGISEN